MDMPTATEQVSREQVLEAISEVVSQQAHVVRTEAALAAAQRRLSDSVARLSRLYRARGEGLPLPPLAASAIEADERDEARCEAEEARGGTLRERILAVMAASPLEVYTPARLAPEVGSANRDSVRNTLLVLAAKGKIEKVGAGQYRARAAVA